MPRLLKSAIILGATPLLIGTLIYCTWRLERWDWLEDAGGITLALGFAAFVAGTIALIGHLWLESRGRRTTRGPLWLWGTLVGCLLLANFPAALFFGLSALRIKNPCTIRVFNDSDQTIDSLAVSGPGVRIDLGPVGPGRHVEQQLYPTSKGSLELSARQQGVQVDGRVDSYVTPGLGSDISIRIKPSGLFEVEAQRNIDRPGHETR